MAERFSALGQRYSEAFRSHSRIIATSIGIILAIVANVDSMRLANAYMNQDGASQAAIALQDSLVSDFESLTAESESNDDSELTREQVAQTLSKSKASLDAFRPTRIPIGWGYFPYNPSDKLLAPDHGRHIHWGSWVAGCILTGVLAGFGAGFWYDAVVGVSKFRDRARGAQPTDTQAP